MRKTYLASPYTSQDPDPAVRASVNEARFDAAAYAAAKLTTADRIVFSPIAASHPLAVRGNLPGDWTFWKAFDEWMIGNCDDVAVLMLPGWQESMGIKAELEIAARMRKPVEYVEP